MIPNVRTLDDIRTVLFTQRRWRRRQRLMALRHCQRQLFYLVRNGQASASEAAPIRAALLRQIAEDSQRIAEDNGRSPPEVDATDAAMRLAEEQGVDLTEVDGTGKEGRITFRDVRAYVNVQED